MSDALLAALSALGGAFIGTIGGAIAAVLAFKQARESRASEERRHLWQLGLDLGTKEWETHATQGGRIWPPQLYAYFSARFLQLAAENKLTPAAYENLSREVNDIVAAIEKAKRRQ